MGDRRGSFVGYRLNEDLWVAYDTSGSDHKGAKILPGFGLVADDIPISRLTKLMSIVCVRRQKV